MSSNSKSVNNQCKYCKQQFSTNYDLNRQLKRHLMDKDFQNSLYEYATDFQKCLEQTICTIDLSSNHSEPHCSRTLAVSQPESEVVDLTTHSNMEEETLKQYKCSLCSYKTKSRGYINRHLRAHAGLKTYSCSSCLYQAENRSMISKHYHDVHSAVTPFKCPRTNCSYSGNESSQLTAHMKMHSAERPFVCSFPNCNFKTRVKPNLNRHEAAHSGDKRHRCPLCTFSSNKKKVVSDHVQSDHDPVLDAGQGQSCSSDGKSSENKVVEEYTHVQWSMDWGGIMNHALDEIEGQSSRIVIKVESKI